MKYIIDLPEPIKEILLELFRSQMRDNGFDVVAYEDDFLNSKVTDIETLYEYVLELTIFN